MIVVADASAIVEYLLTTSRSRPIRDVIEDDQIDLHIPALCDIEVNSALRRALSLRLIAEDRAEEAVDTYLDLPLSRHGHETLLPRMLELRRNFFAYDAAYVALAEELTGTLLTADARLARAVNAHSRVAVHGN